MSIESLINLVYSTIKKVESQPEYQELLSNNSELGGRTVFDTLMSVPEIALVEYPELFILRQSLKKIYKESLNTYQNNFFENEFKSVFSIKTNLKTIYQDELNTDEVKVFLNLLEKVVSKVPDKYKEKMPSFDIILSKKEKNSSVSRNLDGTKKMIVKHSNNLEHLESEIAHEIGHLLEMGNFNVRIESHRFLRKRIYYHEKININDFCEQNNLDLVDENQIDIYPGPFISPYVGKVYDDIVDINSNTEVISLGFQSLLLDPINFLFKDVEHFMIIYNLLKGKI